MSPVPEDAMCAYCRRRPAEVPWRPFCSERCRLLDLGRWLGGDYRIPGEPVPEDPPPPGDKDSDT